MSAAGRVVVLTLPEREALARLIDQCVAPWPDQALLDGLLPTLTKES